MIYDNIKKLCKEIDISISQLEKEAGLGNGTISGWKKSMPRIDSLQAVAAALNVNVEKLLG